MMVSLCFRTDVTRDERQAINGDSSFIKLLETYRNEIWFKEIQTYLSLKIFFFDLVWIDFNPSMDKL